MNELAVLDGQIEKAEAQIRRLDQLIVNPAHPLTPEAETRYIAMLAETEAELKRLVKKRAQQQVNQDPSEVIPDFYQIIAQLSSNFSRLSVDHQKLVTRQVIRAIKLNRVSLHLFLLSVVWQNGIAACPDVALIWRGYKPSGASAPWTPEEDQIVRTLYPTTKQIDLLRALPERPMSTIYGRAKDFGLKREVKREGPCPVLTHHLTVTYTDLEKAAELSDDEGDKEFLCDLTNRLATQTFRGGMSCFWFVPLERLTCSVPLDDMQPPNISGSGLLIDGVLPSRWPRSSG